MQNFSCGTVDVDCLPFRNSLRAVTGAYEMRRNLVMAMRSSGCTLHHVGCRATCEQPAEIKVQREDNDRLPLSRGQYK
jgi:hypothetical protein